MEERGCYVQCIITIVRSSRSRSGTMQEDESRCSRCIVDGSNCYFFPSRYRTATLCFAKRLCSVVVPPQQGAG